MKVRKYTELVAWQRAMVESQLDRLATSHQPLH